MKFDFGNMLLKALKMFGFRKEDFAAYLKSFNIDNALLNELKENEILLSEPDPKNDKIYFRKATYEIREIDGEKRIIITGFEKFNFLKVNKISINDLLNIIIKKIPL